MNLRSILDSITTPGAETFFRDRLRTHPQDFQTLNNLGSHLTDQGRYKEGEFLLRTATKVRPDHVHSRGNLARALEYQGRYQEALALYEGITDKLILANKSMLLLSLGMWQEARDIYRWRADLVPESPRGENIPEWTGQSGHVYVYAEQGLGEQVLFSQACRFLKDFTLECDVRLHKIMQRAYPHAKLTARGSEIKGDYKISMGDLFLASLPFGPSGSYLTPDPDEYYRMKSDYDTASEGGARVGICWRSEASSGKFKSVPLNDFKPIIENPWTTFSVQYGPTEEELAVANDYNSRPVFDDSGVDPVKDLDKWITQISLMDAVVTCSCTTAHLAGALGIPTWVLLPSGRGLHWYWQKVGDKSLFYSSVNLVRRNNSWVTPIQKALAGLTSLRLKSALSQQVITISASELSPSGPSVTAPMPTLPGVFGNLVNPFRKNTDGPITESSPENLSQEPDQG